MAAAEIALAGMNPLAFLRETNQFSRGIQQAIAVAVAKLQFDRDLDRAKMIANEVGKMLSAGFGGK